MNIREAYTHIHPNARVAILEEVASWFAAWNSIATLHTLFWHELILRASINHALHQGGLCVCVCMCFIDKTTVNCCMPTAIISAFILCCFASAHADDNRSVPESNHTNLSNYASAAFDWVRQIFENSTGDIFVSAFGDRFPHVQRVCVSVTCSKRFAYSCSALCGALFTRAALFLVSTWLRPYAI